MPNPQKDAVRLEMSSWETRLNEDYFLIQNFFLVKWL